MFLVEVVTDHTQAISFELGVGRNFSQRNEVSCL